MSDVVDPKEILDAKCKATPVCIPLMEALERCTERVNSRPGTTETCVQELFELRTCVDACVNTTIHFASHKMMDNGFCFCRW